MGNCQTKSKKEMENQTIMTRGKLLILYGSTYGMSAQLAGNLGAEFKQQGFIPQVKSVGDFKFESLSSIDYPVLFLLSTFGTGGPTSDATDFHEELQKSNQNLQNLNYGIFGLGNSSYEFFGGMSKTTDKKLQQLKANRYYQLMIGDANNNSTQQKFNEWKKEILKILLEKIPLQETTQEQMREMSSTFKLTILKNDATEIYDLLIPGKNEQYSTETKHLLDCLKMDIESIKGLKKVPGDTQTYLIRLKNDENFNKKQLKYQTAGNVQIYPENSFETVKETAKLLNLDLNQKLDIQMKQKSSKKLIPTPISVKTLLTKFCDLTGPLTKSDLFELAEYLKDKKKAEKLIQLTQKDFEEQFIENITNKKMSFFKFIQQNYNQIDLPLQSLIQVTRRINPRQYTISSSFAANPDHIDLVITVLKEDQSYGLFTGYLEQLAKDYQNKFLRVSFLESPFLFPKNENQELICVATGSGIGPFRAFCQEKQKLNLKNKITLYFGCRKPNEDDILIDELNEFTQKNIINNLKIAYSRQNPEKKQYVQDLILEDQQYIGDNFFKNDAIFYICGSENMSRDVLKALAKVMQNTQNIASYLTMSKISRLKSDGKIITEIQK